MLLVLITNRYNIVRITRRKKSVEPTFSDECSFYIAMWCSLKTWDEKCQIVNKVAINLSALAGGISSPYLPRVTNVWALPFWKQVYKRFTTPGLDKTGLVSKFSWPNTFPIQILIPDWKPKESIIKFTFITLACPISWSK